MQITLDLLALMDELGFCLYIAKCKREEDYGVGLIFQGQDLAAEEF